MVVTPKKIKKKRKKRITCRIKAQTHQLRRRDPRDAAQAHPISTPHQRRCDVATRSSRTTPQRPQHPSQCDRTFTKKAKQAKNKQTKQSFRLQRQQ